MSYLDKFIEYFNQYKSVGNKELEIKILLDHRAKYPNFVKSGPFSAIRDLLQDLFAHPFKVSQSIAFITNAEHFSMYIKELSFEDGVQIKEKKALYQKTSIHPPIYLVHASKYNLKLTFNDEVPCEEKASFDLLRYKFRFSFELGEWRADLTFIKNSISKELCLIKETKNRLFASGINAQNILSEENLWFWEYVERIEVELEFVGETLTLQSIKNVLGILSSHKAAEFLPRIRNLIGSKAASPLTLKKILPNAIELNKRQYFAEIMPQIHNFYLTDKANGQRALLSLGDGATKYYDTALHCISAIESKSAGETLIECEKIGELFYAYDILKFNGENVALSPFSKRLNYLQQVQHELVRLKKFIRLTEKNYSQEINEFYIQATAQKYAIDGLIFTSADAPYKATKFFKWKPREHTTIDFVVKNCPKELQGIAPYTLKSEQHLYLLFVGISAKDSKKMRLKRIKFYERIFPRVEKHYFPIQFSPSDYPLAYIWYDSSPDLDGKVVEMRRNETGWELIRIREDRANDLSKKNYYGNNFRVAELIWRNYSNPLTLEFLTMPRALAQKDFYFMEKSQAHQAIRKYNNMVKFEIIKKYNLDGWVVDLGCGKAQDLYKYVNLGVRDVLFIDINPNNICEVISRKYGFIDGRSRDESLGIFTQQLDLNRNYLEVLEQIADSGIPLIKNETKMIICNFAIHYFAESKHQIKNLVNLVWSLLGSGGRFVFTCIDGAKIHEVLKINPIWGDGSKYQIIRKYDSPKFTGIGQTIEVLMPFSRGNLYTEPLVNLELIERCFLAKKIRLESQGSFDMFNRGASLDVLEREYISFLSFSVYFKP